MISKVIKLPRVYTNPPAMTGNHITDWIKIQCVKLTQGINYAIFVTQKQI